MTLARLGTFAFELGTAAFTELQRNTAYRWASVDRIGARPARQYMGLGGDTITLTGTVYPHTGAGLTRIEDLRVLAATGEAQQLVDGLGTFHGTWTIDDVRERQSAFLKGGAPRRQAFSVTLTRVDDD